MTAIVLLSGRKGNVADAGNGRIDAEREEAQPEGAGAESVLLHPNIYMSSISAAEMGVFIQVSKLKLGVYKCRIAYIGKHYN